MGVCHQNQSWKFTKRYFGKKFRKSDGVLMDELAVQCPQSLNRVMTNYRNKQRETSWRFPFKVTLQIDNQGEIKTLRGAASRRPPFSCSSILCKIIIMKERRSKPKHLREKGPCSWSFKGTEIRARASGEQCSTWLSSFHTSCRYWYIINLKRKRHIPSSESLC